MIAKYNIFEDTDYRDNTFLPIYMKILVGRKQN